MLALACELARTAGALLLERRHDPGPVTQKGDASNVVTSVDHACEHAIVTGIRARHPTHAIVGEETGARLTGADVTWIVDPLDGTSNYAAGIPWFGVLIGVLLRGRPEIGVMYLPVAGDLYVAERGRGAWRNDVPIRVTSETRLDHVLWAYGMDATADEATDRARVAMLTRLLRGVRNVRATNSLVDAAYTADGRLGGFVNHQCHVWDVAASCVVIEEAGGRVTDTAGAPLAFELDASIGAREYSVLAGAPALHAQALARLT